MGNQIEYAVLFITCLAISSQGVKGQDCTENVTTNTYCQVEASAPGETVLNDIIDEIQCARKCKKNLCRGFQYESGTCRLAVGDLTVVSTSTDGASAADIWFGPLSRFDPEGVELRMPSGTAEGDTDFTTQPTMTLPYDLPYFDQIFTTSDTIGPTAGGCIHLASASADGMICPLQNLVDNNPDTFYRDSETDANVLTIGQELVCGYEAMYVSDPPCCFEATWAIVVTFLQVSSTSHPDLFADYQVMVVTDGTDTYVSINYMDIQGSAMTAPLATYEHSSTTYNFNEEVDPVEAGTKTNINVPGIFVFKLGQVGSAA